jgi:hypothetical protein
MRQNAPMPADRPEPPLVADERSMLVGWLDYHRATLEWKCEGLTDEQLRERSVPPSTMSLLGLVRHMAEVERWWFRRVMNAEPIGDIWCTKDNRDADWDDVATADIGESFATWRAECDAARPIEKGAADLDVLGHVDQPNEPRPQFSMRWVLVHMVEEYARHNGHADLLRERIDGVTGD